MFDTEKFVTDCRAALDGDRASRNVRDIVARAVADPAAVMRALGEPTKGGVDVLHRSDELTVIQRSVVGRPDHHAA